MRDIVRDVEREWEHKLGPERLRPAAPSAAAQAEVMLAGVAVTPIAKRPRPAPPPARGVPAAAAAAAPSRFGPSGARRLVAMGTDPAGQDGLAVERLTAAMNAHDIDAFVACFDEQYESEQPAHPDRAFKGREQVRRNWSAVFEGVGDFRSELVATSATGETEWGEWRWRGTHADGTVLDMAGVIVCGVREGRLVWARLYVEPVEQGGAGIDAVVRSMAGDE